MSSSSSAEREVRIGLVLYGGVSLAIYINGVVQEFLHLVKATAAGAKAGTGTRAVYRKLSRVLADRDAEGEGTPVRFIVDAIAGTSAGGINGVFLAKALALDGDLEGIKKLWVEEGDIAKLINDEGSLADEMKRYDLHTPPASLLNSQRMYLKLLQALRSMQPGTGDALAKEIDLHITATDLHGLVQPIQLSDGRVFERRHKTEFHFRYSKIEQVEEKGKEAKPLNQFTEMFDPFLAFAARCTSSFPFAFEPMQFGDIAEALHGEGIVQRDDGAGVGSDRWKAFYPAYTKDALIATGVRSQTEFEKRSFADGGYLDNKPFSFVIDEILRRQGALPVDRKLFYLEPAPEDPENDKPETRRPNAVANAWMALSSLPRYETIRGDLERARQRNREIDRLRRLLDAVRNAAQVGVEKKSSGPASATTKSAAPESGTPASAKPEAPAPEMSAGEWQNMTLPELTARYGPGYTTYHCVKVSSVTDDLSALLCRHFCVDEDSLVAMRLRRLLEVWRDEKYGTQASGKDQLNTFLLYFDVRFRLRRLHSLFRRLDEAVNSGNGARCERAQRIRAALVEPYESLLRLHRGKHTAALARLGDAENLKEELGIGPEAETTGYRCDPSTGEEERARAQAILRKPAVKKAIDDAVTALDKVYAATFKDVRDRINAALARATGEAGDAADLCSELEKASNEFEQQDMLTFPIQFNSDIGELDEIDLHRVSPADALEGAKLTRGKVKVKGAALGAFAGFLEREWRVNDILWGRLDGAERIITAMLPESKHKAVREKLIREAHEAIVAEELTDQDKLRHSGLKGLALLDRWMELRLEEQRRKPWAETLARSTTLIGEILDALTRRPNEPPKALAAVSRLGRLAWGLIEVSTPRSYADLAFRYWSSVLCALGVLLVLVGVVIPDVQKAGWLLLGITVAARLGSGMVRDWVQAPPEEIAPGAGKKKHRPTRDLLVALLIAVAAPLTVFFAAVGVEQVSHGLPAWTDSIAYAISTLAVAFTMYRGVLVGIASKELRLHAVENWATRADVARDCGDRGDPRRKQLRKHLEADAWFVAAYTLLFLALGFAILLSGAVVPGLGVLVFGLAAAVADYFENERISLNIAVPLAEVNRDDAAEEAVLDYPVAPVSRLKWLLFYFVLLFAAYWLWRGGVSAAVWVAVGALVVSFASGLIGLWRKDAQFHTFALGVMFLPGLPALGLVCILRAMAG